MAQKLFTPEELDAVKKVVLEKAATLVDQKLAEAVSAVLGKEVKVSVVRRVRQSLGLRKSAGRGKCELTQVKVEAPAEPVVSETVSAEA